MHPTLLSDRFVMENFSNLPVYLSTSSDSAGVGAWDRNGQKLEALEGEELFFVIQRAG